jgi:hypothetical protein
MQHEDATSSPHRRLRALALAATVATGIGAFSVTGTARPAVHQHAALETTASASPSAIGCDDYWSRAETLTGIPHDRHRLRGRRRAPARSVHRHRIVRVERKKPHVAPGWR